MMPPLPPLDASLTDARSYTDSQVSENESSVWPPDPTIITHRLAGTLLDRVRRRFTAPLSDATLTETTVYGGYSEWTQENSTEFTFACDGREVTFTPDSSPTDWRADADTRHDSVFARCDAWLAVAERPGELFDEWFGLSEQSGSSVRYLAHPDTIVTRSARRVRSSTARVTLTGISDGSGCSWTLSLVQAADSTGFRRLLDNHLLCYTPGLTLTTEVAREVLGEVSDVLFLGDRGY